MGDEPETSVSVVIRAPGREPYTVTLDRLTAHVRAWRQIRMGISRDELKAKRLKAVGVVGTQMQATADMYDRVIEAGNKVEAARVHAEGAHMADLQAQVQDLQEMADELSQFGQSVPLPPAGASGGVTPSAPTAAPVRATVTPASASAALAALQATVPNPSAEAWAKGDAYVGTHPEPAKS